MSTLRLLRWLGAGAILLTAGGGGVLVWARHVAGKSERLAWDSAQQYLREAQPARALAIVDSHPRSGELLEWDGLEIDALTALKQVPRLSALYGQKPAAFAQREEASLLVYRAFVSGHQPEEASALRAGWQTRAAEPAQWTLADADALIISGEPDVAEKLLREAPAFPDALEPQRLARLAILSAPRDPNAAWAELEKAIDADPDNPDIRSYRGQLLEAAGRMGEARVEYVAALVSTPQNPALRDQLSSFYLRRHDWDQAIATWQDGLRGGEAADFLCLKSAFWSRVVHPALTEGNPGTPSSGPWRDLVHCLQQTPEGQWLDEAALERVPNVERVRRERPEIAWLSLLQALQAGNAGAVTERLTLFPAGAAALAPDLVAGLQMIDALRAGRTPSRLQWPEPSRYGSRHQLFSDMAAALKESRRAGEWKLSDELAALLQSDDAVSAVLLATGWREAALRMAPGTAPAQRPEWLTWAFAQAVRRNRGASEALALLPETGSSVLLGQLRGELLIAAGKAPDGLALLSALATDPSPAGQRAAWLCTLAALEKRQPAAAREFVLHQPGLAGSPEGQELLARCALAENNETEATRIYQEIATTSLEARTWLVRQAQKSGDSATALQLTQELRELAPDAIALRRNLLLLAPPAALSPAQP